MQHSTLNLNLKLYLFRFHFPACNIYPFSLILLYSGCNAFASVHFKFSTLMLLTTNLLRGRTTTTGQLFRRAPASLRRPRWLWRGSRAERVRVERRRAAVSGGRPATQRTGTASLRGDPRQFRRRDRRAADEQRSWRTTAFDRASLGFRRRLASTSPKASSAHTSPPRCCCPPVQTTVRSTTHKTVLVSDHCTLDEYVVIWLKYLRY